MSQSQKKSIQVNYQRYKSLPREELRLPAPTQDDEGNVVLEAGELYCRVPGCGDSRLHRLPYLLRKHIQKSHPDVTLARSCVGKPTQRSLEQAREFYRVIMDAYDARIAEEKLERERAEKENTDQEGPSQKRRRLK